MIVAALLLVPGMAAASQPVLSAPSGRAGCYGPSTKQRACTPVRGAANAMYAIALSPDGRNVYAVGRHGAPGAQNSVGVIDVFARNRRTDSLHQLPGRKGCVGQVAGCTRAALSYIFDGQTAAQALIVSRDGRNVYVAGFDKIFAFERNPQTGVLSQLPGPGGCVANTPSVDGCTPATSLDAQALAISADGSDLYAVGILGALSVLARDHSTGALTQAPGSGGCVNSDGSGGCAVSSSLLGASGIALSPDGRNVYVASPGAVSNGPGSVSVFTRDATTGDVSQLPGISGCVTGNTNLYPECATWSFAWAPASLLVSPDGRQVYVSIAPSVRPAYPRGVLEFARDPATGTLHGAACLGGLPRSGCANARVIPYDFSIAMTADGRRLVVGSIGPREVSVGSGNMVSIFNRSSTGDLKQPRAHAGCITDLAPSGRMTEFPGEVRGCTLDRGLAGAAGLALTPDGNAVYTAGSVIDVLISRSSRPPSRRSR